jgi:hypothetical protein
MAALWQRYVSVLLIDFGGCTSWDIVDTVIYIDKDRKDLGLELIDKWLMWTEHAN